MFGIPIRTILIVAAIMAVIGAATWAFKATYNAGWNAREVEIQAENQRRTRDANQADDAARRCAANPDCRLSDDGYERR